MSSNLLHMNELYVKISNCEIKKILEADEQEKRIIVLYITLMLKL